jgi:hypothetical protein
MGLAKHDDMVVHSRRMDPINLSATPFARETWARSACHGCPLFVVGASLRCHRRDLDRGLGNVELHSREIPP